MSGEVRDPKEVIWVGPSRKDLKSFPRPVQRATGIALYFAQLGTVHPNAKPMKGFRPKVMEIAIRHDTDTYRAIYTVQFGERVYVLHAFQKKAKKGIATPKAEIAVIRERLKAALKEHRERQN